MTSEEAKIKRGAHLTLKNTGTQTHTELDNRANTLCGGENLRLHDLTG